MIVGIPKEVKTREYRVGMVPAGVKMLVQHGHKVLVEHSAGTGSGIGDDAFRDAGAQILDTAKEVWAKAQMIVKVKEPVPGEYALFRQGMIIYTYLHLAATKECTLALRDAGVAGVAYETIQLADGSLPLLRPMSQVAGRMATQVGATHLEKERGGKGLLLGGVPGTRRGRVVIIGGGTVGTNAAHIAVGMGADVTILDVDAVRLIYLDDIFGNRIKLLHSDPMNVRESVRRADLVIGAVLIPGAKAPHLVDETLVGEMEPGSVIVDVAVDQGGCIATCKPTTHDNPTYEYKGIIHYCVANMPGAVSHTSTFALTAATIPYAVQIADRGLEEAARALRAIHLGVNTYKGCIACRPVAEAHGQAYTPLDELL